MTRYGDVVASVLFILLAIGGIVASLRLPLGTPLEPMPGFVPLIVCIFLLGISLLQLAVSLRGADKTYDEVGEHWKQPAALIVGLLLYSLTLDYLGYIIATAALSLLIMRVLEPQSWRGPIIISLALTIFSYVLFDRLLDVDLPEGPLTSLIK
jgi:putative tricarboxylic transport membrane protein